MNAFRIALLACCLLLITNCRYKGIGRECKSSGSGFTMRHSCKTLCMSIWRIRCPAGNIGNSNVCGGELNCSRGSCPDNQVCYQTNMDRSVCIPENICPEWSDPDLHPEVELQTIESLRTSKNITRKTTEPAAIADEPALPAIGQ